MSYNSTSQRPVKPYLLDTSKSFIHYKKTLLSELETVPVSFERPLNPPGHELETVLVTRHQAAFVPGCHPAVERARLFQPKTSDCRAFIAGDVCEVESYFDEQMRPVSFLHGYTTGKDAAVSSPGVSPVVLEAWADDFKKNHPELYDEPDDDTDDEPNPTPAATPEQQAENRKRSLRRAKHTARRVIQANRFDMMWTFTFAVPPSDPIERERLRELGIVRFLSHDQQQDRVSVGKAWNLFMTGFRRYCKEHEISLSWLKVFEPHASDATSDEKRLTYHIHLATSLRINKRDLQRLWGFGVVWFSDYTKHEVKTADGKTVNLDLGDSRDPAFYLCKYIEKDFDEAATHKEKAFTCSQNCKRPQKVYQETVNEIRANPVKGFDVDGMNPTVKRRLQALRTLDAIALDLPDVGHGAGVYSTCYTRKERSGETVEVRGFKKVEIYDARLLLPEHRRRYETWKQKRREREQQRVDQLAFFHDKMSLIEKK